MRISSKSTELPRVPALLGFCVSCSQETHAGRPSDSTQGHSLTPRVPRPSPSPRLLRPSEQALWNPPEKAAASCPRASSRQRPPAVTPHARDDCGAIQSRTASGAGADAAGRTPRSGRGWRCRRSHRPDDSARGRDGEGPLTRTRRSERHRAPLFLICIPPHISAHLLLTKWGGGTSLWVRPWPQRSWWPFA